MLGGSRFGTHAATVRTQLVLLVSLRGQDTSLEALLQLEHTLLKCVCEHQRKKLHGCSSSAIDITTIRIAQSQAWQHATCHMYFNSN